MKVSRDNDEPVIRRLSLDPFVLQSLEADLMNAMINPDPLDSLNTDEHYDNDQNTSRASTTFTMETFHVTNPDDIPKDTSPAALNYRETKRTEIEPEEFCYCCRIPTVRTHPKIVGAYSKYSIASGTEDLLPPQDRKDKGKITLVLDLDETLVHSSFMAVPQADFSFTLGLDSNKLGVYVCIRPGVTRFLETLSTLYELVLFTASTQYYADYVVDKIDPDRFIKLRLYRESCTDFGGAYVKDLLKLGRDLKKVIIVDNSSVAYLLQPYNAIAISSWYDDPADQELEKIRQFLLDIHDSDNVYDNLAEKYK